MNSWVTFSESMQKARFLTSPFNLFYNIQVSYKNVYLHLKSAANIFFQGYFQKSMDGMTS